MDETILVCKNHDDYPTPLIWTFAFIGSEYWCPYCGFNGGMMWSGERIELTEILTNRKKLFKEFVKESEYLHAKGLLICKSFMWEGNRIPPELMPEEERNRLEKIVLDWSYRRKIDDISKTSESV